MHSPADADVQLDLTILSPCPKEDETLGYCIEEAMRAPREQTISGEVVIVGALLVRGPLHLGNITLDIHTLFFAAMAVLIGFQSATFAVFTKVFAIQSGVLPQDARFQHWFRFINLEKGLAAGGLLALAGLALSLRAVGLWGEHRFGPLVPGELLRWVIPGGLLLTLGCQTVLVSFFLSILGLPLKR
jgi:hypothetical protein